MLESGGSGRECREERSGLSEDPGERRLLADFRDCGGMQEAESLTQTRGPGKKDVVSAVPGSGESVLAPARKVFPAEASFPVVVPEHPPAPHSATGALLRDGHKLSAQSSSFRAPWPGFKSQP